MLDDIINFDISARLTS